MRGRVARNNRSRGFTLVELLVVISILALLLGLALPSLKNAMTSANQAKSTDNLRGIGAAIGAYLADNDGKYPFQCGSGYVSPYWSVKVTAYLPPVTGKKTADGQAILVSPVMMDPMLPAKAHHPLGDYGCNNWVFVHPDDTPSQLAAAAISRASELVTVMTAGTFDSNGQTLTGSWYVNASYFSWGGPYGGTGCPTYRSTGYVLALFADGHVSAIAKKEFQSNRWFYLALDGKALN